MSKLKEDDVMQLIMYLDNIYAIAEKEIETRKWKDRKEKAHE